MLEKFSTMPKFTVYYIPETTSQCYRLGSSILGYDIRKEEPAELLPEIRAALPTLDPAWRQEARPYGFHLTIGDSIEFRTGDLYHIVSEVEGIVQCFAPHDQFILSGAIS
jgi:hypothetical protein